MMINKEDAKNNRVVRHVYYFSRGVLGRNKLYNNAENTLEEFGINVSSKEDKDKMISDMIRMNMLYGFDFDEYLYFDFFEKPLQDRLAYVADWEHLGYTNAMNNYHNADIFDNKWKTYQKYHDFYHRDVIHCNKVDDYNEFASFVDKHKEFITKPINKSCGHGVKVIRGGVNGKNVFNKLIRYYKADFLVEELIRIGSDCTR